MTLERILSRRLRQRILKFRRQPRPYRSRSMHTRTHRDTNRRLPFDWVKSIDRPLLIDTSATQRRIHALLFHSIIVALMLIELNEWTYQWIALWTLYRKSFGSAMIGWIVRPQIPAEGSRWRHRRAVFADLWTINPSDHDKPKTEIVERLKSYRSVSMSLLFDKKMWDFSIFSRIRPAAREIWTFDLNHFLNFSILK